jgi:hypothetical protein
MSPERAAVYGEQLRLLTHLAPKGCSTLVCVVGTDCEWEARKIGDDRAYFIKGVKRELLGLVNHNL